MYIFALVLCSGFLKDRNVFLKKIEDIIVKPKVNRSKIQKFVFAD